MHLTKNEEERVTLLPAADKGGRADEGVARKSDVPYSCSAQHVVDELQAAQIATEEVGGVNLHAVEAGFLGMTGSNRLRLGPIIASATIAVSRSRTAALRIMESFDLFFLRF